VPASCQSATESIFALDDDSPNRIAFDLERVMRTKYLIDDFQQTYFVIESFEKLLEECYRDFAPLYERLKALPDINPYEVRENDSVLTKGTLAHFRKKPSSR
jgi:phenylalanine-4-hydroxylase